MSVLSQRETEVLRLVDQGYIAKEIAEMLHISLTTVITHNKNIIKKLNARNITHAISIAHRMGFF